MTETLVREVEKLGILPKEKCVYAKFGTVCVLSTCEKLLFVLIALSYCFMLKFLCNNST